MKKGVEYAQSKSKVRVSNSLALLCMPFAAAVEQVNAWALRDEDGEDRDPVFKQTRLTADDREFEIEKARTLSSKTGKPINGVSVLLRKGPDEILQVRNIRAGDMHFIGHRALEPVYREVIFDNAPGYLVDEWNTTVKPTRAGILSTFSLEYHNISGTVQDMAEHAEAKLYLDIKDVKDGSVYYDYAMLGHFAGAAIRGDL